MVAYVFDRILAKGVREGQIPARTQQARRWFRSTAKTTRVSSNTLMGENKEKLKNRLEVGKMYMFYYDPKHKKTLPYYDRFPLIFPFQKTEDGFLGINLHYLPYVLRAKLMDALYQEVNNTRYDETTKLDISYNILKGASRFKWFKPTVKRYLKTQIRSRFLLVDSAEWDIALFLPVEQFEKASKSKVWQDSKNAI